MKKQKTKNDLNKPEKELANKYIDFKVNGQLFPAWILHNFKKYRLDEVKMSPGEDPCKTTNISGKKTIRKYQEFIVKYLDYEGPYKRLLLYHGLGSGKTAITLSVYNMLFNYTPGWNVFILIRASLHDDPWMQEIKEWLETEDRDIRFNNIRFVHYDSPFADRDFSDAVRESDSSKKNYFIIDEAHNFFRNVYSNINSKSGRRAINIYNAIKQDILENDSTRIVLITGTPAVNVPFELALIFNLLRPGSFPDSENKFNQMYVTSGTYTTINLTTKNKFMRRIIGLVSYYIGATPDRFATSTTNSIDISMDKYQEDVYGFYEAIETKIEQKKRSNVGSGSEMYMSYTRQACNFVFPPISQKINGENRPRPNNFRISEREALSIDTGLESKIKLKAEKFGDKYMNVTSYVETIQLFLTSFEQWLDAKQVQDESLKHTINTDVKNFLDSKQTFKKFWNSSIQKSSLLSGMYMCSPKFTYIIMTSMKSPGPSVVYTNYVRMEGIDIIKIYLKFFGFDSYNNKNRTSKYCYGEFHGGIIDRSVRQTTKVAFNSIENLKGNVIKIILFSPAGTEGISLANVRQVHITEPYWNEVRIVQMIGRAIRQCSHKDLPMQERHVEIYRYKMVRKSKNPDITPKITTDQLIEGLAKNKNNLLQSFYMALQEIAVDCELNRAHNMMSTEYKCFKFEEQDEVLYKYGEKINSNASPAYKDDEYDDDRIDSGMYSPNSLVKKIKVIEITAVKLLSSKEITGEEKYSSPDKYWYYSENGHVYDHELKYLVGKVLLDENKIPHKLDKNTYIIDYISTIAMVDPMF
jgi:superfamily II DNA or RNA helicase